MAEAADLLAGLRVLPVHLLLEPADHGEVDAAARQLWHDDDPIGHRVGFIGGPKPRWFTIVGVIANLKQNGLDSPASPHVYFSLYQVGARSLGVVARVKPNASEGEEALMASVGEQIRREVQAVDKDLLVFGIQPMTNLVSGNS